MIELVPDEYRQVLPILGSVQQKVLPYAICQGINPGRVWVDQRTSPSLALIWSTVGYYILAGNPRAEDIPALKQILTEYFIPASQLLGETGYILIPVNLEWKNHLPGLLPGRETIEIYRRPHRFHLEKFAEWRDWRNRIPQGFRLEAVDEILAEKAGILGSWGSAQAYARHGFGFALFDDNELACICTSVLASQERVEIDVHTVEKYRRQGLAVVTAAAFIEECLKRGKQPNWECFWDNLPSTQLAEKLGFETLPDYPVYYWEEAA